MGDAADYDIEVRENRALYPFGIDVLFAEKTRDNNRRVIGNSEWETATGQKIKFKDMGLDHLRNVSKLVTRRGHKYAEQLRDYYEYRVTMEVGETT